MRLTSAQREFLQLAVRTPSGNPWTMVGIRQRCGGAKLKMFERMKERGFFDDQNRITPAGRKALEEGQ